MDIQALTTFLRNYQGRPLRLMEVCGTHTAALQQTGIRQLLPPPVTMLSGPGCPVCVTPTAYIDKLVEYARTPGYCVLSFGDMLRVPGSRRSLADARAAGGRVEMFYAPEKALERAAQEPQTTFVLAAVGFETTAPVWAQLALEAAARGLKNVRLLTSLKTMPEVMAALCARGGIDGFLCPGHVAVITGTRPFAMLAKRYGVTMVVGGFSPELLLRAMCRLVLEAGRRHAGLWNEYPEVVRAAGNKRAQELLAQVLTPGDAAWRGLGVQARSGLYLASAYAALDAGSRGLVEDVVPPSCQCGKVLQGELTSRECPLFGKACTPEHPIGACMVSREGACAIAFRNR